MKPYQYKPLKSVKGRLVVNNPAFINSVEGQVTKMRIFLNTYKIFILFKPENIINVNINEEQSRKWYPLKKYE